MRGFLLLLRNTPTQQNNMKHLPSIVATLALTALAWLAWQTPQAADHPSPLRLAIPSRSHANQAPKQSQQHWRVITRRVITKPGRDALQARIDELHLPLTPWVRRESITLHAFDDPHTYTDRSTAAAAVKRWIDDGIEASIIHDPANNTFTVALGRYYEDAYAESLQADLQHSGRPYHYASRNFTLPVWRFISPATDKQHAQQIWKQLQTTGIAMPALIRETDFQRLYSAAPSTTTAPSH